MIIVREVFIAKPGMASKMAKMFKEDMPEAKIMTDLVGQYNTVIMEGEYESLGAWEAEMKKHMEAGKQSAKPAGPSHTEMYMKGHREILRVW